MASHEGGSGGSGQRKRTPSPPSLAAANASSASSASSAASMSSSLKPPVIPMPLSSLSLSGDWSLSSGSTIAPAPSHRPTQSPRMPRVVRSPSDGTQPMVETTPSRGSSLPLAAVKPPSGPSTKQLIHPSTAPAGSLALPSLVALDAAASASSTSNNAQRTSSDSNRSASGTSSSEKKKRSNKPRRASDAPLPSSSTTSSSLADSVFAVMDQAPPRTTSRVMSGLPTYAAPQTASSGSTRPQSAPVGLPPASMGGGSSSSSSGFVAPVVAVAAAISAKPPVVSAPAGPVQQAPMIAAPVITPPTISIPKNQATTTVPQSVAPVATTSSPQSSSTSAARLLHRAIVPTKLRQMQRSDSLSSVDSWEKTSAVVGAAAAIVAGTATTAPGAPVKSMTATTLVNAEISPSTPTSSGSNSPTLSSKAIRPPAPLPSRPTTPVSQTIGAASLPGTPDSARTLNGSNNNNSTPSNRKSGELVVLSSSGPTEPSTVATITPRTLSKSATLTNPPAKGPELSYPLQPASPKAKAKFARWKFWNTFRATLALILASGFIAGISYRIAMMKKETDSANLGVFHATNCSKVPDGYAVGLETLEPSTPYAPLFGFQMDWAKDTPMNITKRVGRRPGIYGAWLHIDSTGYDKAMLDWYPKLLIQQAREMGGDPSVLLVTLLPNTTMDNLPEGWMSEFAGQVAEINMRGVGVVLRFAHEMNGPWHPYGQLPLAYKSTFRKLYGEIKRKTNMTAVMWAPNAGNCGYPWVGAYEDNYYEVPAGDKEKAELDTNGDGRVDVNDDPYTPYYPGDQYVDWIGLSVYHYSIPAPDKSPPGTPGTNTIPRSGLAESLITGDDLCDPSLPVWSISRMAEKSGKPLAVPETGAVFYTTGNVGGPKEVDVKGAWWRQVLDLGGVGGVGVKMLLWFEEDKVEPDRGNVTYAVTHDPSIRAAFLKDVNNRTMLWGDEIAPWCGGQLGDGVPWGLARQD